MTIASPMRILLVTMHYPPSMGGLENVSALLAGELVQRGHAVQVVTERLPMTQTDELHDGVQVHRVPALPESRYVRFVAFSAAVTAYALRHRDRFDLIHVQQMMPPAVALAVATPVVRRPLVVTNHLSGEFGELALMRRLPMGRSALKLVGRRAACVGQTEEMRQEMRDAGMGDPTLISNGIELPPVPSEQERAESRVRLGLSGRVVLCVARLEPVKDIELLIEAFARVRVDIEASLVIVGDGSAGPRFRAFAKQSPAAADIHFMGTRSDLRNFLSAADVFAFATKSEGMSIVLLQAMGVALPIVASDIGGNRHALPRPDLGRLSPPGNVEAFAAYLRELLSDPDSARAMGRRARAHVEQFSVPAMADAYEALYSRLIAERRYG